MSVVKSQPQSRQLDKAARREGLLDGRPVALDRRFKCGVAQVASADPHKMSRSVPQDVRLDEIRVLGDDDPALALRPLHDLIVGGGIPLGQVEGVSGIHPLPQQPSCEPAGELGIDQEVHAARGWMRCTRDRRAA